MLVVFKNKYLVIFILPISKARQPVFTLTTRKKEQFSLTMSGKNIADVIKFSDNIRTRQIRNPMSTAQHIDVT